MYAATRRTLLRLLLLASMLMLCCMTPTPLHASTGPLGTTVGQPVAPSSRTSTGLILVVDPATVDCAQTTTFDDVAGGSAPGTNYDGLFTSIGVYFGERFAGQVLSFSGNFDVLSGSPTNPLVPITGTPGQNLNIVDHLGSQVLDGLGPLGFPDFDAIGEGAMAMYFTQDQSQISFQLVGGNGGSATLDFFRRDGSLIDEVIVTGLAETSYGFKRLGGVKDITGVSIFNADLAGIGIDNVCHDVPVVVPVRAHSWGGLKAIYR